MVARRPFRSRSERGSAMVEAAIAIPLLVLLMLGLSDILHLSNAYLVQNHVNRELAITAGEMNLPPGETDLAGSSLNEDNYRWCVGLHDQQGSYLGGDCPEVVLAWRLAKLNDSHAARETGQIAEADLEEINSDTPDTRLWRINLESAFSGFSLLSILGFSTEVVIDSGDEFWTAPAELPEP